MLNSGIPTEHINELIFIIQETGILLFYNVLLHSGILTKHINTLMYIIQLENPHQ